MNLPRSSNPRPSHEKTPAAAAAPIHGDRTRALSVQGVMTACVTGTADPAPSWLPGYEDGPFTPYPELLEDPLFWLSHLGSCARSRQARQLLFGADCEAAQDFYRALWDREDRPLFTVPLTDGHRFQVVHRTIDGDRGTDYLLHHSTWDTAELLAQDDGHFMGPALSWPELAAAADLPPGPGMPDGGHPRCACPPAAPVARHGRQQPAHRRSPPGRRATCPRGRRGPRPPGTPPPGTAGATRTRPLADHPGRGARQRRPLLLPQSRQPLRPPAEPPCQGLCRRGEEAEQVLRMPQQGPADLARPRLGLDERSGLVLGDQLTRCSRVQPVTRRPTSYCGSLECTTDESRTSA